MARYCPMNRENTFSNSFSDYVPPTKFTIGETMVEAPLVSLAQIKGHLALLHAFAELKKSVYCAKGRSILTVPMDKDKKWAWFVGCAVERFDIWCRALQDEDLSLPLETIMPPLDVMMVWHTYMLNPRWYQDDSERLDACRRLKGLERQFSEGLAGKFLEILPHPPSVRRKRFWQMKTSVHFAYSIDGVGAINKKTIMCPSCSSEIVVVLVNPEGTGYLQKSFSAFCHNHECGDFAKITKETLAVCKMARDLFPESSEKVTTLPGLTPEQSQHVRSIVFKHAVATRGRSRHVAYARSMKYSMEEIRDDLGMEDTLVNRMFTAYTSDKIYSVELASAVLRQESFISKMYELCWTQPGYFDAKEIERALHHALARYHAFLDLISSSPKSFFVPTLDIDLVWHTHQLIPSKYKGDCEKYCSRFIDHDDKVEGLHLSSSFEATSSAWKDRFGIDYSLCGCPTKRKSFLKKITQLFKSKKYPDFPFLIPSTSLPLKATHPSDHNAVRFFPFGDKTKKRIENAYNKMKKKAEKAKKADDYDTGQLCGSDITPFLVPPPTRYPLLYCVAMDSGQHVQPAGSCGSGCGGGCGTGGGACGSSA